MALTLKQIRLLTPGQSLQTHCDSINGWSAACRTAYKGRKEVIETGLYDCEVKQDSISQSVNVIVKCKDAGREHDKHSP